MANSPSSTITRKIDFTTEAVVLQPERLGAALDLQPLGAGDDADHQRHERRLDHADLEMGERDRLLQARDEDLGAHAAIEPGDQAAAVERRHRAEEGQHGQRDDQREDARQDQHLDRIEAHGAQRVDLLAHLHRAELGRVGAARAAGDHDGDDQHADLAQHEDADHVDDVLLGAELAEMEEALLGDDAADQEGDEQNDRHRLPADAVELMDGRGEAELARARDHAEPSATPMAPSMSAKSTRSRPKPGRRLGRAAARTPTTRCRGLAARRLAIDAVHLLRAGRGHARAADDHRARAAEVPRRG